MCGRYTIYKKDALKEAYGVDIDDFHPSYNAAPGQFLPVLIASDDGYKVEMMKWGLIPVWSKDSRIGYKLINARSETAFEKPMWRNVIKSKRCLIPANGFYEWKRDGKDGKQPFYIFPKQRDIFSFAGVWELWKDSDKNEWKTYSIMTTSPNKEMASVHDRMPVILRPEDEKLWLSPDAEKPEIESLLHPYENDGLEMYEVSRDVNVVGNNEGKLILPINSQ